MSDRAVRTLPNLISLSRLGLAIAFVSARGTGPRVAIVGVAAATDFLDGWLARRANWASHWGALIDPISDRVFMLTALGVLLFRGEITTVQYFVLISRDLMTAIGFLVAKSVDMLRPVEFRARWSGKIVTVMQLFTLFVALVAPAALAWCIPIVGILSAWSIADYTLALWRARVR